MMLGMWFVLSKQFSDKLSEDVKRGLETAVDKGLAVGVWKYGYLLNDDGYHEPHPEMFPLMQKAFQLKIYNRATDRYIAEWLNSNGFQRYIKGSGWRADVDHRQLNKVWKDPFYAGTMIFGNKTSNLIESNPHFKPMINQQEFDILTEKVTMKKSTMTNHKIRKENESFMPLEQGLLTTPDGLSLTMNLPNKGRFIKKRHHALVRNPNAELSEFIKPINIKYGCKVKDANFNGLEVSYDEIEKEIIQFLKKINLTEEQYQSYAVFAKTKLDKNTQEWQDQLA